MKRMFIILIVVVTILACNNDARYIRDIKMLTHQKIDFPEGYVELACNSQTTLDSLLNQDLKIVSYYGDVVCTPCCAKTLKRWQGEIKNLDENISFIIVAHSVDNKKFSVFTDSLCLDYPIMLYKTDVFEKTNNLGDVLARNRTFLLNKDNEIILVGEPFDRKQLSELYKKCIDSMRIQN